MILNVNKQEVQTILELIRFSNDRSNDLPDCSYLAEKLKRLQIASETVKSTIEQVQTAE